MGVWIGDEPVMDTAITPPIPPWVLRAIALSWHALGAVLVGAIVVVTPMDVLILFGGAVLGIVLFALLRGRIGSIATLVVWIIGLATVIVAAALAPG